MSTYTAQQVLDELHKINIPDLFAPEVALKERTAQIKVAKLHVRRIKKQLREEQSYIKKRLDGRNRTEAVIKEQALAPYNLVDDLIDRIEVALSELESSAKVRSALPRPYEFGTLILHSEDYSEWILTDASGATKWQQEQRQRKHEKRRQELQEQFDLARVLISQKEYVIARTLLATIDHPKADELFHKVDRIIREQEAKRKRFNILVAIVLVVVIIVIGLLAFPSLTTSSLQLSRNATANAANTITAGDSAATRTPALLIIPVSSPTRIVPTSRPSSGSSGLTRCRDGTYSSSTGRGTCSHHGGIDD